MRWVYQTERSFHREVAVGVIAMKTAPPVRNQDAGTCLLDDRSQRFCHFLASGEVTVGVRHHSVLSPKGDRGRGRLSKLLGSVGGRVHVWMTCLARCEVQQKDFVSGFDVLTGQVAGREVHVTNMPRPPTTGLRSCQAFRTGEV